MGAAKDFEWEVKDHVALGENLQLGLDFQRGQTPVPGSWSCVAR